MLGTYGKGWISHIMSEQHNVDGQTIWKMDLPIDKYVRIAATEAELANSVHEFAVRLQEHSDEPKTLQDLAIEIALAASFNEEEAKRLELSSDPQVVFQISLRREFNTRFMELFSLAHKGVATPYIEWALALLSQPSSSVASPVEPQLEPKLIRAEYGTNQNALNFDWIYVPEGVSIYGDHNNYWEWPMHRIYLPGYYIAKTPITNAIYKFFVDATGHRPPSHWRSGHIPPNKENHPVTHVSWHDAQAFCSWAGVYLPGEAEWEKAARGTDGRTYPWGNDSPTGKGNFSMYEGDTTPVDKYPNGASPYGCLDMFGNVKEWTSDVHDRKETIFATRTVRGEPYWDGPAGCGVRDGWRPQTTSSSIGFRVLYHNLMSLE